MKLKFAFACAVAVVLSGCAALLPQAETIKFSGRNAELRVVKTGCVLDSGTYTDVSGRGNSHPMARFIAVSNGGQTVGQWTAYCEAVVPNGTSSCKIFGPKKAASECGNYDRYMVTN